MRQLLNSNFSSRLASVLLLIPLFHLIFISFLPAADSGNPELWITSDIQGYLVGCDCPSGASAGISSLDEVLGESGSMERILLDIGGLREPERSDLLLEKYLDEAVSLLGYEGILASSGDLRDGWRLFEERCTLLNLSSGGAIRIGGKLFLRKAVGPLILEKKGTVISVHQWYGAAERRRIKEIPESRFVYPEPRAVVESLSETEADFRILAVRGGIGDWEGLVAGTDSVDSMAYLPDLLVFTGPESPAAELAGGGLSGVVSVSARDIRWLSLSPRGNGLARIETSAGRNPDIRIQSLERGISPESERILRLGDSYMDDLVAKALEASGRQAGKDVSSRKNLDADYWYPHGCRDCEDFLWNTVPALEHRSGVTISIREFDTGNPNDFDTLQDQLAVLGTELRSIPVMIIGDTVLQGDEEIKAGLSAHAEGGRAEGETLTAPKVRWEPGAVFLAGLLDGVNPCAFSAMVFLVSALAMARRERKTMLAIGLAYAAGVFITYGLIGAGLLGGLKRIAVESGLRNILELVLVAFLLVLAVLSLIDAIRLSRGRSDLLLKLPQSLSKRVHGIIRNSVRSGAAAGGSFMLGAVVALIELGCTGQVYLPTIAWMIARDGGSSPWIWLLIYNIAFIIPLLIVFVVSYRGVSAMKLAGVFQRRGSTVKYVTAGLFAVLALVVFFA